MAKKKKKKKIYVYTNRELEIKERFVKLYEEFAPEKVRRGLKSKVKASVTPTSHYNRARPTT
jgi:hypothetical protein